MADRRHRDAVCPRIAYMPQGLGKNLYPTLSVEENLQFFGRLFGHDAAERRRRIDSLTRSTGMAAFLSRPAGKLSGGMKQKLGLCCALIHDPDLLILDEPTTGVDPLARAQFWDLINAIRAERPAMSVIVATAYMDEARRFDWLIALDDGRVLAQDTPAGLQARGRAASLEEAFIALLPEEKRRGHEPVRIVPLALDDQAEIAIEARDLTMRFGDFVAVDHVNFRIRKGEIFGFLGSNGCGKSTTMKMLTGLLPASEGRAWLFGQEVDPRNIDTRRRVGYMSQAFSLYGELTVEQNLVLHARLFHVPEAEIPARVDEMAARFSLDAVRDAAREPAHGRAPAPVAGRGHGAQARAADPGRTDLGRGPGGARQLLAPPDRAGAAGPGHDLHLHALHERGRALRPHVADARWPRAGQRLARRDHARARRGHAGRGLHRLPDRRRRRRQGGRAGHRGRRRPTRRPCRPPSLQPAAHAELYVARSAGAAARPGARHAGAGRLAAVDVRHRLRHQPGRGRPALRGDGPRPDRVEPELRAEPVRLALLHRTSTRDGLPGHGRAHAQRRAVAGHRDPAGLRPRRAARQAGADRRVDRRRHAAARRDHPWLRAGHAPGLAGAAGARAPGRLPRRPPPAWRRAFATTPTCAACRRWCRP